MRRDILSIGGTGEAGYLRSESWVASAMFDKVETLIRVAPLASTIDSDTLQDVKKDQP
jgi:hypothetical protein